MDHTIQSWLGNWRSHRRYALFAPRVFPSEAEVILGLTVGLVLVPQSMSYAKIATLTPEYGLYASFVGVFVYCVCIKQWPHNL
jgi:MFS superfamily sulfate permease-like transporter